jgi:hypothetical protein
MRNPDADAEVARPAAFWATDSSQAGMIGTAIIVDK